MLLNSVLMENATQNKLMDTLVKIANNVILITVLWMTITMDNAWDMNVTMTRILNVKEPMLGVTLVYAKFMNLMLENIVQLKKIAKQLHLMLLSCNVTLNGLNASINLLLEELVILITQEIPSNLNVTLGKTVKMINGVIMETVWLTITQTDLRIFSFKYLEILKITIIR